MAIDFAAAWDEWVRAIKDRCPDLLVSMARRESRQWKSEGRGQYKCCSPLRADHGPSFQVYANGTWHDWSTKDSGDTIQYVMIRDRVDFKAALNILAAEANLPSWEDTLATLGASGAGTPRATAEELLALWHQEEERRAVRLVLHDLIHLCHDLLPSSVRAYLQDHYGFSDETIDFEKIGWVPAGLYDFGIAMGHTRETLVQTGLFFDRAGADPDPIAHHRILFPYWKDGMVEYAALRAYGIAPIPPTEDEIARGERDLKEFEKHANQFHNQKYKKLLVHSDRFPYVSPTIANSTLWGEDSLRQVRPDVTPLLIEGAPDVLIARQIGFPVTLSPITTSPSNAQLQRIVKWARGWKEIVVLNDNEANRAGAKGAIRVGKALWKEGVLVRIATLPRAEGLTKVDVNEYVRSIVRPQVEAGISQDEAEAAAHAAITAVVETAQPLLDFLIADLTPETEDLDERMRELGTLAQRLEPIARENFLEQKIIKGRLKKASAGEKKAYRAAFGEAAKVVAKAKKEEEKPATAPGEPTSASTSIVPPASDDTAWDDLTPEAAPTAAAIARAAFVATSEPPIYLTPTAVTVVQRDGTYERETSEGRLRISNFALQLLRLIVPLDGPEVFVCRVLGPTNFTIVDEWKIPHTAWSGKRHFLENFPSAMLVWSGTDDEVQAIKERLIGQSDTVPRVRETPILGFHEVQGTPRFVLVAGTLNAQGQWMDAPDLAFSPTVHSGMQTKLARVQGAMAPTALAREVWPLLATCYAPQTTHAMIAWFAACPFKPKLQQKLGSFPILNVYGTAGSGKSSLLQHIFWPAFGGIQPRESLFPCDQSKFIFTSECSATNAIPIVFDEYKPNEMTPKSVNELHRLIKGIYGGETRLSGNVERNRIFQVNAPLCIGGETKIENDLALVERCIFVPLDKNWVRTHPDASAIFFRLRTLALHTVATQFQAWSLRVDVDAVFARAEREEAAIHVALTYDARVRANIVCALFGLAAYEAFAESIEAVVPAIARAPFVQALVRETLEESEDGSFGHTVDALDQFVLDAAIMANGGVIKEGMDYTFIEKRLFLYLDGIEAKRAAWKRTQGDIFQSPGLPALRRIAGEKLDRGTTYVLSRARAKLDGDRYVRGLFLDHDKIIAMGGDGFPCTTDRTHGGIRKKYFTDN